MSRSVGRPLRVGEHVRVGDAIYRVGLVNGCRARLDLAPGGKTDLVSYLVAATGTSVEFETLVGARTINVSPNAFLERVS